jgi:hypothetical protein
MYQLRSGGFRIADLEERSFVFSIRNPKSAFRNQMGLPSAALLAASG